MMKQRFFLLVFLGIGLTLTAQQRVPARPEPAVVMQPNGDSLTIRLVGDEWHHHRMTVDGYMVVQDKRGYWCYCKPQQSEQPSCRKAHDEGQRTRCEQRWLEKHFKHNE